MSNNLTLADMLANLYKIKGQLKELPSILSVTKSRRETLEQLTAEKNETLRQINERLALYSVGKKKPLTVLN